MNNRINDAFLRDPVIYLEPKFTNGELDITISQKNIKTIHLRELTDREVMIKNYQIGYPIRSPSFTNTRFIICYDF